MTPTVPSSNPGRRVRTLVPLHTGLGFGAEAIRARALDVARTAQARHDAKRRDVERTALGSPLETSREDPRVPEAAPRATPTAHLPRVVPENPSRPFESLEGLNARGERLDTPVGVLVTPGPGRGRALAAWALDGVVSACVLVLGAVTSYALAPTPVGRFLASATIQEVNRAAGLFGYLLDPTHAAWMTFVVQSVAMAIAGLFLCQLLSVSFFRSTLGRFVVGIELSKAHLGVGGRVGLALSEALTLGGIFALPFVLATPKRVPLFSWIKLEAGE